MNRKQLVSVAVATLGLALIAFAGATWFATKPAERTSAQSVVEQNDRLVRAYSPVLGPRDAAVTIVEFFDPACEACRAFYPMVKQIMNRYPKDVRLVLRYTPFHGSGSETAIKVLEVARLQDVYIPVLEALLKNQPIWAAHDAPAEERIMQIAGEAGLDVDLAKEQVKMPDIVAIVNLDRADVQAIGIQRTPTFFVNGKPLPTFGSEELSLLVDSEVKAARGS